MIFLPCTILDVNEEEQNQFLNIKKKLFPSKWASCKKYIIFFQLQIPEYVITLDWAQRVHGEVCIWFCTSVHVNDLTQI